MFIDDHPTNVAAAEAVGIVGLRFVDAMRLRRDLRVLGVPIAASRTPEPPRAERSATELSAADPPSAEPPPAEPLPPERPAG